MPRRYIYIHLLDPLTTSGMHLFEPDDYNPFQSSQPTCQEESGHHYSENKMEIGVSFPLPSSTANFRAGSRLQSVSKGDQPDLWTIWTNIKPQQRLETISGPRQALLRKHGHSLIAAIRRQVRPRVHCTESRTTLGATD